MVVEIKEYGSAEEIAKTLDKDISATKSTLGEYLRRLDEIRSLAEKSKKIREVVMKLAGKTKTNSELPVRDFLHLNVAAWSVAAAANPGRSARISTPVVTARAAMIPKTPMLIAKPLRCGGRRARWSPGWRSDRRSRRPHPQPVCGR